MKKLLLITLLFALLGGSLPVTAQTDAPTWVMVYQAQLPIDSRDPLQNPHNYNADVFWSHEGHDLYFPLDPMIRVDVNIYQEKYDPAAGETLFDFLLPFHFYPIWSPDESMFAGFNEQTSMFQIYSGQDGTLLNEWKLAGTYKRTQWSHSGNYIGVALASEENPDEYRVEIFSREGHLLLKSPLQPTNWDDYLVWSPDERYVAFSSAKNTVQIADATQNFEVVHTFNNVTGSVVWHPSSQWIAVANDITKVRVWSVPQWELTGTAQQLEVSTSQVYWNEDGSLLVVAGADGFRGYPLVFSVWTFPEMDMISKVQMGDFAVVVHGWDPTFTYFVIQEFNHTRIFDAQATRELWNYEAIPGGVAMSPDGQWLIGGIVSGRELRIHRMSTGEVVATLAGHQDEVYYAQWSADSQFLFTVSEDGDLRVWGRKGSG